MGIPHVCTCMYILTLHGLHSHLEDGVVLVELAFHHSSELSCGGPEDFDMHGGGAPPLTSGGCCRNCILWLGRGGEMKDCMAQGDMCVVRWGTLTLSQGLPQSHLMPVHHHVPVSPSALR